LTWYEFLKTVHILAVAIWVGGGIQILIHGLRAMAANDTARLAGVVSAGAWTGPRVFTPASLLLVITGFLMIADADWDYKLWVILGLIGWFATFITGSMFLGPTAKKVDQMLPEKGHAAPEVTALNRRLLNVVRVDAVVLVLVLADMVIKPGL
jgi:uncharacterized membrane protein